VGEGKELKRMNGKSTIGYLTGMLLVIAAMFVVISGASPALAEENGSGQVISGMVSAINTDSGYSYLTLRAPDDSEFTVVLDNKRTDAWMCDGYVFLHNVKEGDMVDISYFESGAGPLATSINDHGQGMTTC
jgi:hypothetical protein